MSNIESSVLNFLQSNKIKKTTKFVVGCSGGVDSIVLCFALKSLGYKNFTAVICNHGIRAEAAIEADEVCKYLKQNAIKAIIIQTQRIDTSKNIEQNARNARYKELFKFCIQIKIYKLFIAHHLNDQTETFLMRLERGTGLKGLCSIRSICNFEVFYNKLQNITVYRPFLEVLKTDIVNYARKNEIKFWYDKTNDNEKIKRNFIRKYLINNKAEKADFESNLKTTINNLHNDFDLLNEIFTKMFKKTTRLQNNFFTINLKQFCKFHYSFRYRILDFVINKTLFTKQCNIAGINELLMFDLQPVRMAKIRNLDNFLLNNNSKIKIYSVEHINFIKNESTVSVNNC